MPSTNFDWQPAEALEVPIKYILIKHYNTPDFAEHILMSAKMKKTPKCESNSRTKVP